jgi:hypothetical protein
MPFARFFETRRNWYAIKKCTSCPARTSRYLRFQYQPDRKPSNGSLTFGAAGSGQGRRSTNGFKQQE